MLVKSDDETDIGVESGHSAKVEEQQRRYEYIQNREAIEVQWREEERMLYLSVCILSALIAIVGGNICGYYLGLLHSAESHHNHYKAFSHMTTNLASFPFFSTFFSIFSLSPPSPPPASSASPKDTNILITASSSLGGGLVAFVGLIGLYHFANRLAR